MWVFGNGPLQTPSGTKPRPIVFARSSANNTREVIMAKKTLISWADASWPVTVGCTKVSAGCPYCYAMRDARRMENNPNPKVSGVYNGLVERQANGLLNWTGMVRELPERLDWPAKWQEHRDIFVCSQSDLFHEGISGEFIGRVFSTMWNNPQHTYYVLTKRPERILQLLAEKPPKGLADLNATNFPHVIIGVSAEDQDAAETRLPLLTQLPLPAHQIFVSAEPLIGPLNLSKWMHRIGWVIAGGESGKHARPMHPDWPRSLRDQCQEAGIAYHFKQWGEFLVEELAHEKQPLPYTEDGTLLYKAGSSKANKSTPILTKKNTTYYRVGRSKAGRILDGMYWDARPGQNENPIPAAHPIGSLVTICSEGEPYDGVTGTIEMIVPDDPKTDPEIAGEEATYYIQVDGKEIPQSFGYWNLEAQKDGKSQEIGFARPEEIRSPFPS